MRFVRRNTDLVIWLALVAWCTMWLAIGVQYAAFWWFMLGFGIAGVINSALRAYERCTLDRRMNIIFDKLDQQYADIEWDSDWEPTAEQIANMEKG